MVTQRNGRRYPVAKVKGGWTAEEDAFLSSLVTEHGEGCWSYIANALNRLMLKSFDTGRIGKQCRERWSHNLRPDLKKDSWTEDEELLLIDAHQQFGNHWSDIAKLIPGRSENSVKNHWNAVIRRKEWNSRPTPLRMYMQQMELLPRTCRQKQSERKDSYRIARSQAATESLEGITQQGSGSSNSESEQSVPVLSGASGATATPPLLSRMTFTMEMMFGDLPAVDSSLLSSALNSFVLGTAPSIQLFKRTRDDEAPHCSSLNTEIKRQRFGAELNMRPVLLQSRIDPGEVREGLSSFGTDTATVPGGFPTSGVASVSYPAQAASPSESVRSVGGRAGLGKLGDRWGLPQQALSDHSSAESQEELLAAETMLELGLV